MQPSAILFPSSPFLLQITNSVRHTSLACLAARVVRAEALDTAPLPATLQAFVAAH
jgi:hypothetical protein